MCGPFWRLPDTIANLYTIACVCTGQLLIGLALFSLLPGLSLYGRLGPAGLALTGFLLCVVQALAVWAWSRSFRTGPVEWLLDRLSRRQFGPLRRGPGA